MALRSSIRLANQLCSKQKPWARAASAMPDLDHEPWSPAPAEIPDYNGWDPELESEFLPRRKTHGQTFHQSRPPVGNPRAGICDSVLELVGQTPMIRMTRLSKELGISDEIDLIAKCEFFNAGGSVKDRVGLRMVEEAEKDGRIKPGDTLIEPTSGNTGIGLSLAGAVKGYNVVITMPMKMSGEKLNTMKALGAEIIRTPTEAAWNAPDSHITLAAEMAEVSPNAHVLDQYLNAGNPLAHYDGTAEEMLRQTGGDIDVVVMTAGTGGTATGVGRKLKEVLPNVKVVAVDPVGSILAVPDKLNDYKRFEGYQVEGIGYDFIPTVLDRDVIDSWVKIDDDKAFSMARQMIKLEGLMVGGSSGSCMAGAYEYIKENEAELKGKRVVILCADSIRNYMSKFLDDGWMAEHDLPSRFGPAEGETSPAEDLMGKVREKKLSGLQGALEMGLLSMTEYKAACAALEK